MSLQGTLDTFSLPDVLRFLSAGAKTGRLAIEGPRGGGEVWLDTGLVIAAETPVSSAVADALFELLRDSGGSFEFHADLTRSDANDGCAVAELLEAAEARLGEWRDIEKVVPSLRARVELAPELPTEEVSINQHQWRLLVTIASHPTVGAIGSVLALGEFEVSRAVKELVEHGLTTVHSDSVDLDESESASTSPTRGAAAAAAEALTGPDSTVDDQGADDAEMAAGLHDSIDELHQLAIEGAEVIDALDPAEVLSDIVDDTAADTVDDAFAGDVSQAGMEKPTEGGADPDDPVNRGLLLKFLSSVRT